MLLTFVESPFATVSVLAATVWDGKTTSAPTQGDGSAGNPYQISTAQQLAWFASQENGGNSSINAKLTADIVLNENGTTNEWIPIGYVNYYRGTFDGDGHTIKGIYIRGNYDYTGLFGYVNFGTVKNIGLINMDILISRDCVGGVCGFNDRSTFSNCYNTGTVIGSGSYVGGVCGYNNDGEISNCYNAGIVSGSNNIGGVCGYNSCGKISSTYNSGTVSGIDGVGGVYGVGVSQTETTNCYNTGKISGRIYVGGVSGTDRGIINNCYNTATVSSSGGSNYVGGVCGDNHATFSNCYYLGTSDTDSVDGTTYKTSAQFTSGEVAYVLQHIQSDASVQVWGQTCGVGIPELTTDSSKRVYKGYNSESCTYFYSNSSTDKFAEHTYNNGICSDCGNYEPAVANGGVYEISNPGQLYWFAQQVNEKGNSNIKGKLTQDINMPIQKEWIPIGYLSNKPYAGIFDGNNHTIKGIYIRHCYGYAGLFGYVYYGRIKNIGLIDIDILGSSGFIGCVCGASSGSTFSNCYNTGKISGRESYVGGVCGSDSGSTFSNCYNTGTVSGSYNVGGVCGFNDGSIFSNCYNTGTVSGSESYVGGMCGYNHDGKISNCYNAGTVSGIDGVGGMYGVGAYKTGTTTNCYNTGKISGRICVGGVSGTDSGIINNCYNAGTVSSSNGSDYVGGVCGNNQGSINNSYYLGTSENDSAVGTTYKTAAQFTSGEVAYLLSKGCMIGNVPYNGDVWGQNLNISDSYPTLGGAKVYRYKEGTTFIYTNFVLLNYGDLNADGIINELDYICLKDYILGKINSFPAQSFLSGRNVADLNGDGKISSIDLAYLKRYLNGIVTSFPVEHK